MKRTYSGMMLVVLAVLMMSACNNTADIEEKNIAAAHSAPEEIRQNVDEAYENIEKADEKTDEKTGLADEKTGLTEEISEEISEEIEAGVIEKSTEDLTEEAAINNKEAAINNEETGDTQEMIIDVGGQSFQVTLYDNETVRVLLERLPLTLSMNELHGNEKFYNLDEALPTNSENVGSIQTGDIMLFGSDCLVLFFDDFGTSYNYTRIGHIEDEDAFVNALTDGTVEVTFHTGE